MTHKIRTLIIDHYDSFTYNVKEWFSTSNFDVTVIKWDMLSPKDQNYDLIVISPGPGHPLEYKQTTEFIRATMGKKPIFGICLGMQMLLSMQGEKIEKLESPTHGKRSKIKTTNSILFEGLPEVFSVARYHSLAAVSGCEYKVTATYENFVMAIESNDQSVIAVQFHPESFLTEHKERLISNLASWAARWK